MEVRPNIPIIYKDTVPSDFVNDLDGWSLSKEEVEKQKGKLRHLDIDFGTRCSLNCPMCFRRNGHINKSREPYLDYKLTQDTILEAKGLGLKSVRILGAGEPFEEPRTVKFLEWLDSQGLKSVVFTQGNRVDEELATRLANLNVSIMLRYDSFNAQIVDRSVGRKGIKPKKDRALEILVAKGFNEHNPTRLGIVAPMTRYTGEGIVEIYQFFRDRNIYPLLPFIACAGRSLLPDGSIKDDLEEAKKVEIATEVYRYNFSKGIPYDGVSSYIGTHICTFLSNGFYLANTGIAMRCEGDETSVIGDLQRKSITEIWQDSQNNIKYGGRYNYGCPPKVGKSIPNKFYLNVQERLSSLGLI